MMSKLYFGEERMAFSMPIPTKPSRMRRVSISFFQNGRLIVMSLAIGSILREEKFLMLHLQDLVNSLPLLCSTTIGSTAPSGRIQNMGMELGDYPVSTQIQVRYFGKIPILEERYQLPRLGMVSFIRPSMQGFCIAWMLKLGRCIGHTTRTVAYGGLPCLWMAKYF